MRPADRERVVELTADVWEGHDYLPEVFEAWVADPSADFMAAEEDGVVVGLQRNAFGDGVVASLAILCLGIVLDRITQTGARVGRADRS